MLGIDELIQVKAIKKSLENYFSGKKEA